MIVDAHLDIAWNALAEGRGFDAPAPRGYAVSRAALEGAGVGLVFPTIFSHPRLGLAGAPSSHLVYRSPREAYLLGRAQLGYYEAAGLRLLRTGAELRSYTRTWRAGRLAGVLLMESADAIETPRQLAHWVDLGVRVIGPAWSRTRYCGGSHAPGGLTDLGRALLKQMARHGVILDLSHMADRSMRDTFETWTGPLVATHVGARALNPGQRQLPDWAAKQVGQADGVIGISFFRGHLRGTRPVSARDVADHALHFARVTGDPRHVGLGTDLDGGFGVERAAIKRLADMAAVRRALARTFSAGDAEGIMGGNWLRFLTGALP